MSGISENVLRIMNQVVEAAGDAGRDPSEIKILAAAKYANRQGIEDLLNAGISLIGENRVQSAREKLALIESIGQCDIRDEFPDVKIHMIGYLQRNKVKHALRIFDLIETLDRRSLADTLEKRLDAVDRTLPVLVEVKLTGEDTKTGCPVNKLPEFLNYVWGNCRHLKVEGLMGMGPWDPDPEVARPFYRTLKKLFDSCRESAPDPGDFNTISMGMSADFQVAIQEGATLVRIGRALFTEDFNKIM